jgi:TrpR-related protein YerC/YecD
MKKMPSEEEHLLFEAILTLQTPEECASFFEDICTIKELQAMVQRFQIACQLDAGKNYNEVGEDTGGSSATICRVNKCLHYGSGGYRTAIERLKKAGKLPNE